MNISQFSEPAGTYSDSEWEYEYDENETEDFYVTIELPDKDGSKTSRPDNSAIFEDPSTSLATRRKRKDEAGNPKKRRRRRRNDGPDVEIQEELPDQTEQHETAELENEISAIQPQEAPTEASTLQLMNLNTKSPLLSFNGRIYECDWATTLGTDMIFVKRDEEGEEEAEEIVTQDSKVLESFNNWDLVACSGARLVASEAVLKYKPNSTDGSETQHANNATLPASSFLRRLVDLQAKKGEIDARSLIYADELPAMSGSSGGNQKFEAYNALMGEELPTTSAGPVFTSGRRKPGPKRKSKAAPGEEV